MAYDMQQEVEKVLASFSAELMKIFRQAIVSSLGGGLSVPSAPAQIEAPKRRGRKAKAAPAPAPASKKAPSARRGPKSSPEEVEALGEKILDLLKKEGETMASSDMRKRLHVHEGQFTYALNKLKEDGRVEQVGERRMARYGIGTPKGAKAKAPRKKPGRKPKAEAPAAEAPAAVAEG